MKNFLAASLLLVSGLAHADITIEGLYQSNAGLITEALIAQSYKDSSIQVDTSVYTVVTVTKVDAERGNTIKCVRHLFGITPAQYSCEIKELN